MNTRDKRSGPEQPNVPAEYPDPRSAARPPGAGAEDRPGFDLGGEVNDTTAGSGLGLGEDAEETPKEQRLPRPPA